jgi:hypothetical protein
MGATHSDRVLVRRSSYSQQTLGVLPPQRAHFRAGLQGVDRSLFLPVSAFDDLFARGLFEFTVQSAARRPRLFAEPEVTGEGIWSLVIALDTPVFFRDGTSQLYEVTLPVPRHTV